MMLLYSHDDRLMCKVFPSSLGSIAMRWFNSLKKGSIRSFRELIQEFGTRFITCSKVPQPIDALLSIRIRNEETLRSYTNRYWELYNKIGGGNEQVATSTFKLGLLKDSKLKDSLTMLPPKGMHQLMRRIEEFKRLEDDCLSGKGKAPATSPYRKEYYPDRFQQKAIRKPKASV